MLQNEIQAQIQRNLRKSQFKNYKKEGLPEKFKKFDFQTGKQAMECDYNILRIHVASSALNAKFRTEDTVSTVAASCFS